MMQMVVISSNYYIRAYLKKQKCVLVNHFKLVASLD